MKPCPHRPFTQRAQALGLNWLLVLLLVGVPAAAAPGDDAWLASIDGTPSAESGAALVDRRIGRVTLAAVRHEDGSGHAPDDPPAMLPGAMALSALPAGQGLRNVDVSPISSPRRPATRARGPPSPAVQRPG